MPDLQDHSNIVDVANWPADEEFPVYPEGAREKRALFCPSADQCKLLIPSHRYLLKFSVRWAPEQFWCEILAHRIGIQMDVEVPPALVALDSNTGRCGALIEFFIGRPGARGEAYVPGGDSMQTLIRDYDRARGHQHNFEAVSRWCRALAQGLILSTDWVTYWAKVLAFDSLIGNTDRHHNNWGTIFIRRPESRIEARLSPAFDNGTSLGYELTDERMRSWMKDQAAIARYVAKGQHHMKWQLADKTRRSHADLLSLFCAKHDSRKEMVLASLALADSRIEECVSELTKFEVPTPFSPQRAEFLIRLLKFRRDNLISMLS